jgi:hypothetical protein
MKTWYWMRTSVQTIGSGLKRGAGLKIDRSGL